MRRVALVCLLLWKAACCPVAQAGELPRELISAYRPALEAIRQAYVHGTFRGKIVVEYPGQEKFKKLDFVMRASGDKRRVDLTTTQQKNLGLAVGKRDMFMATPIGSLTTSANPGSKVFDNARQLKHATATATIENSVLLKYPYAIQGDTSILDMLLAPNVKVTDVKRVKVGDRMLVTISYQELFKHQGHTGHWDSSLTLSPSQGWALLDFSRTSGNGSDKITHRASLAYIDGGAGVPLVQSIEAETLRGSSQKCVLRERVDVNDSDLGDPSDYYFNSFAF